MTDDVTTHNSQKMISYYRRSGSDNALEDLYKYVSLAIKSLAKGNNNSTKLFIENARDVLCNNLCLNDVDSHDSIEMNTLFGEAYDLIRQKVLLLSRCSNSSTAYVRITGEAISSTTASPSLSPMSTRRSTDTSSNNRYDMLKHTINSIISLVTSIYGIKSIVLSDLLTSIAEIYVSNANYKEALELYGHALSIRITTLGLLHEKTANSHYALGSIYMSVFDYENARKEFIICKKVRIELFGEVHLSVSDCDNKIGCCCKCIFPVDHDEMYVSFYNSFRTREFVLGKYHSSTCEVAKLAYLSKTLPTTGQRIACGLELKDRVAELGWDQISNGKLQYQVSIYICLLNDNTIVTLSKLKQIVRDAINSINLSNAIGFGSSSSGSTDADTKRNVESITRLLLISSKLSSTFYPRSPSPTRPVDHSVSDEAKHHADLSYRSSPARSKSSSSTSVTFASPNTYTPPASPSTMTSPSAMASPLAMASPSATLSSEKKKKKKRQVKITDGDGHTVDNSTSAIDSATIGTATATAVHSLADSKTQSQADVVRVVDDESDGVPFNSYTVGAMSNTPIASVNDTTSHNVVTALAPVVADDHTTAAGVGGTAVGALDSKFTIMATTAYGTLARRKDSTNDVFIIKAATIDDIAQVKRTAVKAIGVFLWIHERVKAVANTLKRNATSADAIETKLPIPTPPPLPTSWPPVSPYIPETLSTHAIAGDSVAIGTTATATAAATGSDASKLRKIGYESLQSVEMTIWSDSLESIAPASLLFPDIEEKFGIVSLSQKKRLAAGGIDMTLNHDRLSIKAALKVRTKAVGAQCIISPQRSQHLSIMLAKFGKTDMKVVADTIRNFDTVLLGLTAVLAIEKFLPTLEEVKQVDAYVNGRAHRHVNSTSSSKGDDGDAAVDELKLPKVESYIYEISKIPHLGEKLKAMTVCLTYRETTILIESSCDAMSRAVNEIKGSSKLKYLFKSIIDLLCALNKYDTSTNSSSSSSSSSSDTSRLGEGHNGIRLSSLNKLSAYKTNDGNTFDRYLVSRLYEIIPEVLDIDNDMPSLSDAKKVNFERMHQEIKKLESGIKLLESFDLQQETMDAAVAISNALKDIRSVYLIAVKQLHQTTSDFNDICVYFGESNNTIDPVTIFSSISTFVKTIVHHTAHFKDKNKRLNRNK